MNLQKILCVQKQRVVGRDWYIRWRNQRMQIHSAHTHLALAAKVVLIKNICRDSGNPVLVTYQGQYLDYRALPVCPKPPSREAGGDQAAFTEAWCGPSVEAGWYCWCVTASRAD